MAPVIHCVRHAQGYHNLGFYDLLDPSLTPDGEAQCRKLCAALGPAFHSRLSLIAASPLTRTLHTALLVFEPVLSASSSSSSLSPSSDSSSSLSNTDADTQPHASSSSPAAKKILALPQLQEISDYPCDLGSPLPVLQALVQDRQWPVDLSLVHEGWDDKSAGSISEPSFRAIRARAREGRRLLRERVEELASVVSPSLSSSSSYKARAAAAEEEGEKEKTTETARGGGTDRSDVRKEDEKEDNEVHIGLVSHGGFLHYFTEDWEASDKNMGTGWDNCEIRSFNFASHLRRDRLKTEKRSVEDSTAAADVNGEAHVDYNDDDDDDEAWLVETMESRRKRGLEHPTLSRTMQEPLFRAALGRWRAQGLENSADSEAGQDEDKVVHESGHVRTDGSGNPDPKTETRPKTETETGTDAKYETREEQSGKGIKSDGRPSTGGPPEGDENQ